MKTIKIWSLLCVILLVSGCKQNNWLDWKTQNELFLMQNAQREGIITTPTGLQYECIFPGLATSARPDNAKKVKIKYHGELINGYQFDSKDSYIGYVNQFVPGFCEGLKKMNEFGIFKFYIPYDLGYGNQGKGTEGTTSHIPPYSTLIFYVELKDVI